MKLGYENQKTLLLLLKNIPKPHSNHDWWGDKVESEVSNLKFGNFWNLSCYMEIPEALNSNYHWNYKCTCSTQCISFINIFKDAGSRFWEIDNPVLRRPYWSYSPGLSFLIFLTRSSSFLFSKFILCLYIRMFMQYPLFPWLCIYVQID